MPLKILFSLSLLLLTTCVSRRVNVPPFIPPAIKATLSELIEIVNSRQKVKTFRARADLQFETREGEEAGIGRRYRTAQGRVLLARPQSIRLQIEAPLIGTSIAEMASDGQRFQLLIYPQEHRALIEGSNRKRYIEVAREVEDHPELAEAGPLVNIRPQHFTDAFLFEPIDVKDPDTIPFYHESRELEDDQRPGAREGQKVWRSYYVLYDTHRGEQAPRRKYWFDRNRGLILARQHSFDAEGLLIGEVRFSDHLPPDPVAGQRFAATVLIDRPYEEYTLRMTLDPESVVVNGEIPAAAFSIEAPPEWTDSIRRIDLDMKSNK